MVSRIDLGPDGGPYVEIDEDAGDLVIRVPNDTVDFDSNDLLNAVLQNATMDGGSLDGVSLASALDADTQEIQNANLQNATLSDALDANNQDLNSVGTASVASLEAESVTTDSITHLKNEESLQDGIDRAHNNEISILFVPPGTYSADITLKEGVAILGAMSVNNRSDPSMRRFIDARGISGDPPAVRMQNQTALIGFNTASDGFDVVIDSDSENCRMSDCLLQIGDGLEINGDENFVRFNEIRQGITDNGTANQLVGNVT